MCSENENEQNAEELYIEDAFDDKVYSEITKVLGIIAFSKAFSDDRKKGQVLLNEINKSMIESIAEGFKKDVEDNTNVINIMSDIIGFDRKENINNMIITINRTFRLIEEQIEAYRSIF